MPSINIYSQVSTEALLQGVEKLPTDELEQFVDHVLALRARRLAKSLNAQESYLLQQINQPVPADLQQRFDALTAKKNAGHLSEQEAAERQQVIEAIEQFDAERLQHLASLAKLRQVSLPQLMQDLGIKQPEYV